MRTDDSYDPAFGRVRRAKGKRQRKQDDDQDTFAKRDRHVERLATGRTPPTRPTVYQKAFAGPPGIKPKS